MLTLIGGAVRSGKTGFALALARRTGPRRGYIATAEAGDLEMRARIARHRRDRGDAFETVEAPVAVVQALEGLVHCDAVVLDCLTIWIANLLLRGETEHQVLASVAALSAAADRSTGSIIVVTNEVGMGVVPPSSLGRAFRDVCGRAHQMLTPRAEAVYLGTLGGMLRLKPGPVELEIPEYARCT